MRWIGLFAVLLGGVILGVNAFGDRNAHAASGPVIGGILLVSGLLLLVSGRRPD